MNRSLFTYPISVQNTSGAFFINSTKKFSPADNRLTSPSKNLLQSTKCFTSQWSTKRKFVSQWKKHQTPLETSLLPQKQTYSLLQKQTYSLHKKQISHIVPQQTSYLLQKKPTPFHKRFFCEEKKETPKEYFLFESQPEKQEELKRRNVPTVRESREVKQERKRQQEEIKRKAAFRKEISEESIYYNTQTETDETKASYSGDLRYPIMAYNFNETASNPGKPKSDLLFENQYTDEQQVEMVKEEFRRSGESLDHVGINQILEDESFETKQKAKIIFEMCKSLANDGHLDEAVYYLKTAFFLDPTNVEILEVRAELNEELDRVDDALEDYAILYHKDKKNMDKWVARTATLYSKQGRYMKARSVLESFSKRKGAQESVDIDQIASFIYDVTPDKESLVIDRSGFQDGYYEKMTSKFPIEIRMGMYGRGVYATRDIPAGTPIFYDSPIVTTPLFNPNQSKVCHNCYKPLQDIAWIQTATSSTLDQIHEHLSESDKRQIEESLREDEDLSAPPSPNSCPKCKATPYCSTDCQKEDLISYHSHLCSGVKKNEHFQQLNELIKQEGQGGEQTYFLLRLFAKLDQERLGKLPPDQPVWNHLKRLCYNRFGIQKSASIGNVEQEHYQLLRKIFPKLVGLDNYLRFRSVINANALTLVTNGVGLFGKIQEGEMQMDYDPIDYEAAAGIFPLASYLNHSCVPNVTIEYPLFNGIKNPIHFVASRDITRNEELFWNYGSTLSDPLARREMLFEKYFFDCQCPSCKQLLQELEEEKQKTKPEKEEQEREQFRQIRNQTSDLWSSLGSAQLETEMDMLKNK